jgi:hypothetical protein
LDRQRVDAWPGIGGDFHRDRERDGSFIGLDIDPEVWIWGNDRLWERERSVLGEDCRSAHCDARGYRAARRPSSMVAMSVIGTVWPAVTGLGAIADHVTGRTCTSTASRIQGFIMVLEI